jgi:cytochrome P450
MTAKPVTEIDLPWIDFGGERYAREPLEVLREARERYWIANSARGLQVLTHDAVSRMALDPRLDSIGPDYYTQQGGSQWIIEYATNAALPMIPAPRHDRIKKVLQKGFGLKRINEMRETMRAVANRLLDRMIEHGGGDLVEDFSHRYPLEVLCTMMGVPETDIERFGKWTVDLGLLSRYPVAPHAPKIDAALQGLYGYFTELVAERRAKPQNDFVSTLVTAQSEGEDLSEAELLGALVNLLFAGHDTTRYQFGWVIQQLMKHREQWDMVVANPALASGAVEETIRTEPSLTMFLRKVVEDAVYGEVLLPKGTLLTLNSYAANHDPAMFPDPYRFDITRRNAGRQLTFGYGPHVCLGNALARAEMTEALQLFLARVPRLSLAGEPEFPEGQATESAMRGAEKLPVSMQASAS